MLAANFLLAIRYNDCCVTAFRLRSTVWCKSEVDTEHNATQIHMREHVDIAVLLDDGICISHSAFGFVNL